MTKYKISVSVEGKNFLRPGISESIFAEIAKAFPNQVKSAGRLELQAVEGDPNIPELLSTLKGFGIALPQNRADQVSPILIQKYRSFTSDELEEAEFLVMEPFYVAASSDKEQGYVTKDRVLLRERNREVGLFNEEVVVRGKVKDSLVSKEFGEVDLIPIEIENGQQWPSDVSQIYLLQSRTELPPINNLLFDNKGNVFKSNEGCTSFPHGCILMDDFFAVGGQMKYNRGEVEALQEFDIAMTHEKYGSRDPSMHRRVIVSQRFRQFCESLGVEVGYIPVVLE